MKKTIFPTLVAGLLVISCSKKEEIVITTTPIEQTTSMTKEQTYKDVTFEGTIPCTDCLGIKTKLELDFEDKTFELEETYLEKKEGEFKSKGTFEVNENKEFVTLKEERGNNPRVFHITADAAYLVEKVGDKVIKEEYKLAKK